MLGRDCLVHPEHVENVPIQPHHVRPRPRGGGDSQMMTLCANAHGRVHRLLDEIEAYATMSPYATAGEVLSLLPPFVLDNFHVTEQVIAFRGWGTYGAGFVGGRYVTAHRLWLTDGTAREDETPHFDDLYHAARWSRRWRKEMNAL